MAAGVQLELEADSRIDLVRSFRLQVPVETFRTTMELVGTAVDAAGVLIVVIGALLATVRFVQAALARVDDAYRHYRQGLGRAILLGLEFLVAGDIIRTVVVAPTLDNVIVLALIVVIRTFLSMALELELEGHFPWARGQAGQPAASAPVENR